MTRLDTMTIADFWGMTMKASPSIKGLKPTTKQSRGPILGVI